MKQIMTLLTYDTPAEHSIFSWLSPQQRLQLVHEVMVGLLYPDEPLPPETIQHYTTYLALVAIIRTELEFEIETFHDGYDETTDDDRSRILTPEESEERIFNMDLISRQAEKNKKKIDCAQNGTCTRPVEELQAAAATEPLNSAQRISSTLSSIFAGPPVSTEARRLYPPSSDNKLDFALRLLADDALQEQTNGMVFPP
jgi:hypothetical protein